MTNLNKRDAKSFRSFIGADSYTLRAPYGRRNITRKRLSSIIGASNPKGIISDPENNRRIIPIGVISINHALFNSIDKKALFMEAYDLYMKGESWKLNQDDIKLLEEKSQEYHIVTVEQELIQQYYEVPVPNVSVVIELTATEILTQIETFTKQKINTNNIGKAMGYLGFEKGIVKVKGAGNTTKQVYYVTLKDMTAATESLSITDPGWFKD
jgi:predicted P-loop ATPase